LDYVPTFEVELPRYPRGSTLSRVHFRAIVAAIASVAMIFGAFALGSTAAQAITVNLNYAAVAFSNGTSDIGTSDPAVGSTYRYSNAATVGSQGIDAIVTEINKTNASISVIDEGTPSQNAPGTNLNTQTTFTGSGGSQTYQIDFVEAGTNTPITLQNVAIVVWDIDYQQFAQFAGITSYKMDASSVLTATTNNGTVPAGSYRFHDAGGSNSSASSQPNWVEVRYAQVNSIQIVLGATQSGGAFFSMKFAPEIWNNAVSTTPAATSYTITYDGNTNTSGVAPASTTGTGGQTVSSNTGSLDKTGFYLAGWNTAANGSGATYLPGSTIIPVANTTLYAVWVAGSQPTYTLTYDGNSSDGGAVPTSTTGFGSYSTSGNTGSLTKSGYTFAGWNTAANGSGTTYQASDLINLTSNITLYAVWTSSAPASYSLTYNPNNSSGGSTPSTTSGSGSVNTAPNSGGLTRDGYAFAGWNTAADGSGTTYQPGDTINLSANVTLYAMWTPLLAQTGFGTSSALLTPVALSMLLLGFILLISSQRFSISRRSTFISE
jgi:uncharacterized repeat protein (TIGR02543 family)